MSEPLSMQQALIRKLTDIVSANLRDENFSVEKLAKEAGFSRFTLNRKLRSIKHQDASQFIRTIRLQRAMEMLQNNEGTIAEVAYMVGFGSPAYFTKCFHEYYGYPPGKIKKTGFESSEENNEVTLLTGDKDKKPVRRSYIYVSSIISLTIFLVFIIFQVFPGDLIPDKIIPEIAVRSSIAVLPFRNLSDNFSDQYVYEGVMEEIYYCLTKINELSVISRTSAEQYRNTTKTITDIGKEMDVDYIVIGSGQKFGNSFRIRVQLIDASSDIQIWSESFQQRIMNTKRLFRIQNRIAKNIAAELKATISLEERELMEMVPTSNSTAYNLYLKGKNYQKEYEKTKKTDIYLTAVNLFNIALETDTLFARAYTALAKIYITRYQWKTYFNDNYLDSADLLLNKAISIDNKLDETYFLKGQIHRLNGNSDKALEYYDMALKFNPNYFDALQNKVYIQTWIKGDYVEALKNCHSALNLIRGKDRPVLLKVLARIYLDAGFTEISKDYYDKAYALDNDKASYLGNIAFVEFCLGNFEEALKLKKQQVLLDSTNLSFYANYLGYFCVFNDRNEDAYKSARKLVEMYKSDNALNLQRSHRVGYAFWQVGKKKEAEFYFGQQIKYSEESIKMGRDIEQRKAAHYDLAGTYAFLGNKENAFMYLEELAKKDTFPLWWVTMLKNDLLFESIQNDERFQKMVHKIESKYNTEHERVNEWLEENNMI